MQIVHQLIPGAMLTLLREQPLSAGKVAFAWRLAVGTAIERASTIELTGEVLNVGVTDARWAPEIRRLIPMIKARLDAMLGAGVVARLNVRVGSETV